MAQAIEDEVGTFLERSYETVVDAEPEQAFETFKQVAWYELGFRSVPILNLINRSGIKEEGDPDGVGCVRVVPGNWCPAIREEIIEVKKNELIVYELKLKKSLFPARSHQGRIEFEALGDGKTRIVWRIKTEPYYGCGLIIRFFVWSAFGSALRSTRLEIAQANKKKTKNQ